MSRPTIDSDTTTQEPVRRQTQRTIGDQERDFSRPPPRRTLSRPPRSNPRQRERVIENQTVGQAIETIKEELKINPDLNIPDFIQDNFPEIDNPVDVNTGQTLIDPTPEQQQEFQNTVAEAIEERIIQDEDDILMEEFGDKIKQEKEDRNLDFDEKIFSFLRDLYDDPLDFIINFSVEKFPQFATFGAMVLLVKKGISSWWDDKELREQNRITKQLGNMAPFITPLLTPLIGAGITYLVVRQLGRKAEGFLDRKLFNTDNWENSKTVAGSIGRALSLFLNTIALVLPGIVDGLEDVVDFVKDALQDVKDVIDDPVGTIIDPIVEKVDEGPLGKDTQRKRSQLDAATKAARKIWKAGEFKNF